MIILQTAIPLLLLLILLYLALEYNLLMLPVKGLPVLMYHNISREYEDPLTILAENLELQLMYLKEKGYSSITLEQLSEIIKTGKRLPRKTFLLTFDDAYTGVEKELLPMLERYGFHAVIFVPVAYIGKTNLWDDGRLAIMDSYSLKKLAHCGHIEVGLHSFLHKGYNELNQEDLREDLRNCRQTLEFHHIPFSKAVAYPYGSYPKKNPVAKQEMFRIFSEEGIEMAFRIGNRINKFPVREIYELKRIDIRGKDSFFVFKTKLKKGRAKVFA